MWIQRGKLTCQSFAFAFPLSKTNINERANTHLFSQLFFQRPKLKRQPLVFVLSSIAKNCLCNPEERLLPNATKEQTSNEFNFTETVILTPQCSSWIPVSVSLSRQNETMEKFYILKTHYSNLISGISGRQYFFYISVHWHWHYNCENVLTMTTVPP